MKNHHVRQIFMLRPLFFPCPRSGPPLFATGRCDVQTVQLHMAR